MTSNFRRSRSAIIVHHRGDFKRYWSPSPKNSRRGGLPPIAPWTSGDCPSGPHVISDFQNFFLTPPANHFHIRGRPPHQRGVSRSSRTRGWMRWTRAALLTRALARGWRRRVVLTPRCWCQARGKSFPRGDGGKKADHRGEPAISRKPSRAGMPG
jgi:hypothetical protein